MAQHNHADLTRYAVENHFFSTDVETVDLIRCQGSCRFRRGDIGHNISVCLECHFDSAWQSGFDLRTRRQTHSCHLRTQKPKIVVATFPVACRFTLGLLRSDLVYVCCTV